jgi:beta-phosphoglucomutase-like phosphatase (HAD superfamily)
VNEFIQAGGPIRIGPAIPRESAAPVPAMIYLDRDGTLIEYCRDRFRSVENIVFLQGALDALRQLRGSGLGIAVTSNQSSVSRGFQDADHVTVLHRYVLDRIAASGWAGRCQFSLPAPAIRSLPVPEAGAGDARGRRRRSRMPTGPRICRRRCGV